MSSEALKAAMKNSEFVYTDEYIFDRLVKLEEEVQQLRKSLSDETTPDQ